MKYRGLLAGLFMAASVALGSPEAQAREINSDTAAMTIESIPAATNEAVAVAPAITVREFSAKPAGEQIDIIIQKIDNIMAALKSPTDRQGQLKPESVRQQHLGMAYFVDNLFFNEVDGKTVVDEAAVDRLLIYFDRANQLRPTATVDEILAIFLNRELQNQQTAKVTRQPN